MMDAGDSELDYAKVAIVIPALNAEATLDQVLEELHITLPLAHLVVVDDGSSDATSAIAQKRGAKLIRHERNLGVGAGFKSGIAWAVSQGFTIGLTVGADAQRHHADAAKLVTTLIESKCDLVIGSKFLCSQYVPIGRRVGSWIVRAYLWILFGKSPTDPLSGFRAINLQVGSYCEFLSDGYAFDSELCALLGWHKRETLEVPVAVKYHSQSTRMRWPALMLLAILFRLTQMRLRLQRDVSGGR